MIEFIAGLMLGLSFASWRWNRILKACDASAAASVRNCVSLFDTDPQGAKSLLLELADVLGGRAEEVTD